MNDNINNIKDQLENLLKENEKLKNILNRDGDDKEGTPTRRGLAYYAWRSFITGKSLDKTLNKALSEYKIGRITQETIVSVIASAFNRIYRVSIPFLILALLPSVFVYVQTRLLSNQNKLIVEQNAMIAKQNERIDQQIQLSEAERRSSLMFLMSNIMEELPREGGTLSKSTAGRIIALSRGLRPYRYMDGDTLIANPISPERGQLLISLVESQLSPNSYPSIFDRGDFSYSDLEGAIFSKAHLQNINLTGSNLKRASFFRADMRNANLTDANLMNADFQNADLRSTNLINTNFENANFRSADLSGADFNGANLTGANLTRAKVAFDNWFGIQRKQKNPPIGLDELEKKYKIIKGQEFSYFVAR